MTILPKKTVKFLITFSLILIIFSDTFGQLTPEVVYMSPRAGSEYNSPDCQVLMRFNEPVKAKDYHNVELIISDQNEKTVSGITKFVDDGLAILFKPDMVFSLSGKYHVELCYHTQSGDEVSLINSEFYITHGIGSTYGYSNISDEYTSFQGGEFANAERAARYREQHNLPDNFPAIEVTYKNNPLPGHYFVSARQGGNTYPGHNFMICFDTCGTPVFYKMLENRGSDFKIASNGYLTHHYGEYGHYLQLDSSYNQNGVYTALQGFSTDMHELKIENDSSYWVLTKQLHLVDMSQIVPGGNENATVEENIIQHIDKFGNLLWQWNSLDHIPITDCDTRFVDLTAFYIDYIHINALDFDEDSNLLISSRHLNEITKINASTGDIIWRWGGDANQFTFIEDPDGFYGQHSIKYQGDNVFTLFDNGNFHNPPHSRGLEYELDQQNMTASLKKEFTTGDAPVYSPFMGHMQKNNERAVIVGWASNEPGLVLTEFDDVCDKRLEIHNLDTTLISYRAYKFPWHTNAFYFLHDTINVFGNASVSDTTLTNFSIYNNSSEYIDLTGYHTNLTNLIISDNFPVAIPPHGTKELTLGLISSGAGYYSDALTLYSQTHNDSLRIADQVRVIGDIVVDIDQTQISDKEIIIVRNSHGLMVYLQNGQAIDRLVIYDVTGRSIYNSYKYNSEIIPIKNIDNLTAPVIISVQSQNKKYVKKYLLVHH